jgi:endonuclease/exonuclease/phosphatase family metal-dependent hydrolase
MADSWHHSAELGVKLKQPFIYRKTKETTFMKRNSLLILALGILFLSFIQLAGTLVESIYLLDLLHSSLDAKVAGVAFFFTPLLLLPFYKKWPRGLLWFSFALLFVTRSILPWLKVFPRMIDSGLAVCAVVSLFFLLLRTLPLDESRKKLSLWSGAGLALAVSLSVLLRTVYHGVEYSLAPAGGWTGVLLMAALGVVLWLLKPQVIPAETPAKKIPGTTSAVLGWFFVLELAWFSFSAPAVIARWTQGNYTLVVATVSVFATAWVLLTLAKPGWTNQISRGLLLLWNLAFTFALTLTIALQEAALPTLVDETFVVGGPTRLQLASLGLTLLLFPVIFLDFQVLMTRFDESVPAPRKFVPGILVGSFILILMVFANIFTNVWGYVPLGDFFRGKFWLTYALLAALISLLVWLASSKKTTYAKTAKSFHWAWGAALVTILAATIIYALPVKHVVVSSDRTSIRVMTYNIQQANDVDGEKSFTAQLALIRQVSPDVLSMQETDSTRISLNNNDYVRFYADSLGYYSYFGPTPVNGTYGTSIISKYPLENTHTVYIYSDKDENAIAVAEITVSGKTFSIFDVHPDGSPTVDNSFARTLISISKDSEYVIALGDYNLRDYEDAYKLIDSVYTNVWTSIYPGKISADGTDMSGENRIDHIFISPVLQAVDPVYVLTPDSATDHAVHWTEIAWPQP